MCVTKLTKSLTSSITPCIAVRVRLLVSLVFKIHFAAKDCISVVVGERTSVGSGGLGWSSLELSTVSSLLSSIGTHCRDISLRWTRR